MWYSAAKRESYQVQEERMKASAKSDWWQDAKSDPVWTPYQLLVKRTNKLHHANTMQRSE